MELKEQMPAEQESSTARMRDQCWPSKDWRFRGSNRAPVGSSRQARQRLANSGLTDEIVAVIGVA